MHKKEKSNRDSIKPIMTFLGDPKEIGKQSKEFKLCNDGKKVVSNLAGDPETCTNVILRNFLVGNPEKGEKVYKPCEKLLKKIKRDYHKQLIPLDN